MTRLTVLALFLAIPPLPAQDRPNVLLIVSEDNGPQLGSYGDPYARTPTLDRLAAEGVRFANAFVPYSVCSPSRAAFLTGLHPVQNGQIGLATHKFAMYREDTPNIATLLGGAGYATGLIGKLHVNPESAFPFDFHAIPGANFNRKLRVEAYAAQAARFFQQVADKPFFLSVNFPDAHLPFLRQANGRPAHPLTGADVKPLPWAGADSPRIREQVADYYNCLARLDAGVRLLLEELRETGRADNTLVVYIGDHGAQFPRGKGSVYEGALRVPLIVRWPGRARPGMVRDELASTLDILPTVLAAAGVAAPAELTGRPLQPLLAGTTPPDWREHVFAFTTGAFPRNCFVQHSVRGRRYKLIRSALPGTRNRIAGSYLDESHPHFVVSGATADDQAASPDLVRRAHKRWSRPPAYELYDLETDPSEWTNLADDPAYAAVKRQMIDTLAAWQRRVRDPFLDPKNVHAFVDQQLANQDLGYRRDDGFSWSYVEDFARWRSAFQP